MVIRFKKDFNAGVIVIHKGEQFDLLDVHAQAYVDHGYAVAVPQAEFAVAPPQNAPTFPTSSAVKKAQKARR